MLAVANCVSGVEGRFLQLAVFLGGCLPVFLSKLLKVAFFRLQLKICHHFSSFLSNKTETQYVPEEMLVNTPVRGCQYLLGDHIPLQLRCQNGTARLNL